MEGVEKERDKKRDIHSRLANQREGEEGGHFKRVPGPERKSERKTGMEVNQWKKKPWKETMFTSDLGENPADDAMGIPTGSFLPLVPLFSTSDSDSELSSMGLLSLLLLRRFNPPVHPESHWLTFNFDTE